MKYFDLSEDDSWKIHMLFSPRVVPDWLTKKHITFCLTLYDKTYPQKADVANGRLIEFWFAIKSINPLQDEQFLNYLSRIFHDKMGINMMIKKEIQFIEKFLNYLKNLPEWRKNEVRLRFWNEGKLPDDFNL